MMQLDFYDKSVPDKQLSYVHLNGTPIKVIHSDSTAVSAKSDDTGGLHPILFITETFGNVVSAVVLSEHPTLHCVGSYSRPCPCWRKD